MVTFVLKQQTLRMSYETCVVGISKASAEGIFLDFSIVIFL